MISRQARIVSGKDLSHIIQEDVRVQAAAQLLSLGRSPRLDVLLVGNDPASMWYAEAKRKIGQRVGVEVRLIKLLADADAADIAATAGRSSDDSEVDGVIVELPLPSGVPLEVVSERIDPVKDVDGITDANRAALFEGRESRTIVPATALACIHMIERCDVAVRGSAVAIIGRGLTVGRPLAAALMNRHATVTVCHTHTQNIDSVLKRADVVVAAAGRPHLVTGKMIRPGATVIDAGTNQVRDSLVGDVDSVSVAGVARALTPVPGGVGAVTTALIMANTMRAVQLRVESP